MSALVDGAIRSRVLEYLIKYEPRAFTARELRRLLGIGLERLTATLDDLSSDGFAVRIFVEGFEPCWRAANETDPWPSPRRKLDITGVRR